jgi:hypothetical protein
MKIFSSVRLRNSGAICRHCAHFQNNPALIELAYPGLTTMSSGFASVRHRDGFCDFNSYIFLPGIIVRTLWLLKRNNNKHFDERARLCGQGEEKFIRPPVVNRDV